MLKLWRKAVILTIGLILLGISCSAQFHTTNEDTHFTQRELMIIHKKAHHISSDNQGNVLISASNSNDDINPSIARNQDGILVVTYEQTMLNKTTLPICYSDDYGKNWIMQFEIASDFSKKLISPGISYCPTTDEFFWIGTEPARYNSTPYMYMGKLPSDIPIVENMTLFSMPIGLTLEIFEVTCGFVENNLLPCYICNIEGWSGDCYFKIDKCPGLGYYNPYGELPLPRGTTFYFDGQAFLKTAPASNMNIATGDNFFYVVMQHDNETTKSSEIVYKAFSIQHYKELGGIFWYNQECDLYTDIEFTPWQTYIAFDAADPDVTASGHNVCVVYTQDDDVRCCYSSDDGMSWNTSVVATGSAYPSVFMAENQVYCAYVHEGNVYKIQSLDGGRTWQDSMRLNDIDGTVCEQYGSVDIIDNGVVWTDERHGALDIYFANHSILSIREISGQTGKVSAVIENLGSAVASNVPWSIDFDGSVFIGVHSEGVIDLLPGGSEATISTEKIVFGIGPVTITITVGDVEESVNCFLFGPFIFGLK